MAGRDDMRGTIGERMEGAMIVWGPDGRLKSVYDEPAKPGDEERVARILAHNKAWYDSLGGEGDDGAGAP